MDSLICTILILLNTQFLKWFPKWGEGRPERVLDYCKGSRSRKINSLINNCCVRKKYLLHFFLFCINSLL